MKTYRTFLNELKKFSNTPPITEISDRINADVDEHIKMKIDEAKKNDPSRSHSEIMAIAYAGATGGLISNYSHAIEKIAELINYIENQNVDI